MSQQHLLLDLMTSSHDYLQASENATASRIGGLPEHIVNLITVCMELPESSVNALTEKAHHDKISQEKLANAYEVMFGK